jgi:predicted Rossmann fold nucleotide-binding protein DprA/Smf involved in DNA uptake
LLRLGATPVTAAADVLEAFGIERRAEPSGVPGGLAGALLELLADRPASIDELTRACGVCPGDIAAALIELELAGRIGEGEGVYRVMIAR